MAKSKIKIEFEGDSKNAQKSISELEQHLQKLQASFKSTEIGTAEFKQLGDEIIKTKAQLETASKSASLSGERLMALATSVAAVGASLSVMIEHYKAVIQKSREFEQAQMKLEAASKLTGVALERLKSVSEAGQAQYGLNIKQANELTISLTKLTNKSGETAKTSELLGRVLDLAAAQGMSAQEAMSALNQALLGIDEGTDKFFQKNPSVIYEEFAKSIGTSAGKLTDAQKAQALVNEFMVQGAKVQGQYASALNTTAGKQQALNNAMDTLAAKVGKEADKVLGGILNLLVPMVSVISKMDSSVLAAGSSMIVFATAVGTATAALRTMGIVAATTPIGAIMAVVGLAAGAFSYLYAELSKVTPEMEKAQQLAAKTGDAFQKEYEALKKTNPEIAELARATRDLADAEERLKQIREGKTVGSENEVKEEIENAKFRIQQNEAQLKKLEEQRKRINELMVQVEKAQEVVNKNESAKQQGRLVVGEENAKRVLERLKGKLEKEKALLQSMMGGDKSRQEDYEMQVQRRAQVFKQSVEQKMVNPLLEVKEKIDALNKEKLDPKTDATRLKQINAELEKLQLRYDVLNGKVVESGRRLSIARLGAPSPMSPVLSMFSSDAISVMPIDESQFQRIQGQKRYNRWQSGMLQRVDVAGQQRDMVELTMLRQINEERMKTAKLRGDAKEFEDALAVIERIDEKVKEINTTLSESAERYVGIIGSGLSQVADAFGDQVVAALWNESFSIGQMFEGIAKQFISTMVSELIKQEILSVFTGLFPGGGLLSSLFGFAEGGRPPVGQVSVVGERGVELFKPDAPGRVVGAKEASSQLSSILDVFESPLPSFDVRELSGLLAVQTAETVRLRKVLSAKEFAVDIDGEKANSRLKRVSRRLETRIY